MTTAPEPPIRGDGKFTILGIAFILFGLAVAVIVVVGFILEAF